MELKQQVENLLAEIDRTHRYSTSRIYAVYNPYSGRMKNRNPVPVACSEKRTG
jgi:hypothetical protein